MRRVVITGLGIWSCLGDNLEEVKKSLFEGKSGIVYDAEREQWGYRSCLTGKVSTPQLKGVLDRRARVQLSQEAEYAYLSTLEALKNAKMDQEWIDKNEVGILFGNDSSAKAVMEAIDIVRAKKDTTLIGSGSIFQSMNCTVTMNLSTIFKLKGINFTVSAACASGSHSIGMAYLMIKWGMQNHIICGGAQEVNPFAFGSFDGLSAFSIRTNEPTKASRPFDRDRDGLVPSGGSATVILEDYESAVKRGAPILAEVIGYGFSSNGEHISNSSVDGQVRSLQMALKDANISESEIDYINAHATSTPGGDFAEAIAIDQVFGASKPLVSSTKSMTGHECWMAGASEIVYSMLMMQNDFVAPNINFENPDEASAKLNIASKTVDKKINTFLSNSFGFGGTNSTLVIKKI
ncbi:beta-ketoacyl-[acyl-carrier-protein] synthase family protein [Aurantibacillus circumpalustris]|uniref:beta-ketoacyl-[acyl-carrier-protein] synthase family protein n=1 Tax=Aurantibacillus circumpalustris TaxID=3036359 RepID=UPI00295A6AC4|nr:beta-ketoacyl-[acyl-carrier-protein] synthase family protein [Aurantibacillus circumpalustris]